jgi:succinyldiaminopimelate transaminase
MSSKNPRLGQLKPYPAEALYAKKRAVAAAGRQVFDFSVGDPIEPTDPTIVEAFRRSVPEISQYPPIAGEEDFRQACSAWIQRRFGVEVDQASQILPSGGSKEAIFHLPLAFIDPDSPRRRVLFGNPAYPVYERGTILAGGEPWGVELRPEQNYELRPWELDPESIAQTALIWVNYPHNPTGAAVDVAYFERLSAFCRQHDILLCSDECYVDLYLEPPAPPSALQCGAEGLLVFHSLSKRSGMTGYRAGFISGDPALIATLRTARANFGVAPSVMVQRTAAFAWREDTHVERRREVFRRKRDLFLDFFSEVGLHCTPCRTTFYLWLRTPTDPLTYAEHLADAGIIVSPAPLLGAQQPYVRLALVPGVAECEQAIAAWRNLLEQPR